MHENLRSTYNTHNLIIVYKIMKYSKYNYIQCMRQVPIYVLVLSCL